EPTCAGMALRHGRHHERMPGPPKGSGSLGDAQSAIEHDSPVRRHAIAPQTASQPRIVGENGAGSDEDRVVLLAQEEGLPPRGGSGDPSTLAAGSRDPSV